MDSTLAVDDNIIGETGVTLLKYVIIFLNCAEPHFIEYIMHFLAGKLRKNKMVF